MHDIILNDQYDLNIQINNKFNIPYNRPSTVIHSPGVCHSLQCLRGWIFATHISVGPFFALSFILHTQKPPPRCKVCVHSVHQSAVPVLYEFVNYRPGISAGSHCSYCLCTRSMMTIAPMLLRFRWPMSNTIQKHTHSHSTNPWHPQSLLCFHTRWMNALCTCYTKQLCTYR